MRNNNKNYWRKILNIAQASGILKQVPRTGWVLKGVEKAESVAEHSYRVALLTMMLADKFGLDRNKLVEMALVHDFGEAGIGDIKWETGRVVLVPPTAKHRDEKAIMKKIVSGFKDGAKYSNLLEEFIRRRSKEAKFLKQVDKLEMIIQALEYEAAGYPPSWFNEFWENAEKYLSGKELEGIFSELRSLRKQ